MNHYHQNIPRLPCVKGNNSVSLTVSLLRWEVTEESFMDVNFGKQQIPLSTKSTILNKDYTKHNTYFRLTFSHFTYLRLTISPHTILFLFSCSIHHM